MPIDDYTFGHEYRAHQNELLEIAAMDRLAAEVAPPSAVRRYAATRAQARARARRAGRFTRWWRPGLAD